MDRTLQFLSPRSFARVCFGLTAASLLTLSSPGCATRSIEEPAFERGRVEVTLRSHRRWFAGDVVRRFQHPATLSYERVLHILAAIDIERASSESKGLRERVPAIHAELLEAIAAGISAALEKAGPNQELVVMAVRKQQRLGLFHRKFLTSLVAFVRDDHLHLAFARTDWQVPKNREDRDLPKPRLGKRVMNFRAVPGRGMHSAGAQTVVAPWRNSIYAQPVRPPETKPGARRTILYDSPLPDDRPVSTPAPPPNVSPGVLRELADLEEARRAGTITETEYRQRRAVLLGETR